MQCTDARLSWLLKVQQNLHLSHRVALAAVVQELQELRPRRVVLPLQLRRRSQQRRKKRKRSQTRIWALDYSTRDLRSSLFEQLEKKTVRLLATSIQTIGIKPPCLFLQAQVHAQLSSEL